MRSSSFRASTSAAPTPDRVRPLRLRAAFVGIGAAVGVLLAPAAPADARTSAFELAVSERADRGAAVALRHASVRKGDPIYVFTRPAKGARTVKFQLDGPARSRSFYRVERRAPFDFNGGTEKLGRAYDTSRLSAGAHVIKATIAKRRGGTAVVSATFTVVKRPAAVVPVTASASAAKPGPAAKPAPKPAPDKSAPSVPGSPAVTGRTESSISIGWSASTDDRQVTGYGLYRDGVRVAELLTTGFTYGGLTCGQSHLLEVDAVDAAGNRSQRAAVNGSTLACPQTSSNLLVSTAGSDGAACTQQAPCKSFDRAYRVAKPGQTVEVAAGTYGGQTIALDSTKTAGDDVVFRPAAGAGVRLSAPLVIAGRHVELRDMTFRYEIGAAAQDVTLRNIVAPGRIKITSDGAAAPSEISVIGGEIGPGVDSHPQIGSNGYSTTASPRNILFDGVFFHDFTISPGSSAHVECLQVWAADGLTVRNSRFENCHHFDVLLQKLPDGAAATPRNVLLENNVMDCCGAGYYSLRLSDTHGESWSDVTVRNNSSNKAMQVGPGAPYSDVSFLSNVAPKLDGAPLAGVSADYNVWYGGTQLGSHDKVAPPGFVDAANKNFHLSAGAAAVDGGDPTTYPARDLDGHPRPVGAASDAGAYEYDSVTPEPTPEPPAEEPSQDQTASLFVSVTGSDSNACSKLAPCRSFDRAYHAATTGQVVEVAAGSYPAQWIKADASKTSGSPVVFRPATGARVSVASDLDVDGSYLEFRDIEVAGNWYAHEGSRHVTFRNVDAERFYIASASDIRAIGGDIGPSVDAVAQIKSAQGSTVAPENILLDGLRFHDFTRSSADQHMECLHVMAADGLTIRNSTFDRCSIFGISFNEAGDSNAMRRILVENNWFGDILDGGSYSVHFSSGSPCEATVRFNTFADKGISQECPETGAGVTVSSNILPKSPSTGAVNGYSWDYNVYESGTKLGSHDLVAAVAFVDEPAFDLHLAAGSAAIDRGDAGLAPAVDIDGQTRSAPPDAGADER